MPFTSINVIFSVVSAVFCVLSVEVSGYKGELMSHGVKLNSAYVIGSYWIVALNTLIKGLPKEELNFKIGNETFGIDKIVNYDVKNDFFSIFYPNPRTSDSDHDLAIIKLTTPYKASPALLDPDYPPEGSLLRSEEGDSLLVTSYEECARLSGDEIWYFCLTTATGTQPRLITGSALWRDGMLSGLVQPLSNASSSPRPVLSLTPGTGWMFDTISEAIPR